MPIYGGNYVIKVNGKTVTNKTSIRSSNLSVSMKLSFNKVDSITICYSGNEIYSPSRKTFNLSHVPSNDLKLITQKEKKTQIIEVKITSDILNF